MYIELYQIDYRNSLLLPYFEYGLYAGFPSPGQDYFRQEIDLTRELINNKKTTSIGRVHGQGMEHLGIWKGALTLVDESLKARHKDYVVAWVEGEYVLKRLHMDNSGYYLMALNDNYLPLKVVDDSDFFIFGKVTHIINSCLPVHEFDGFQSEVDLNRLLIHSKNTTYIARITGESMIDIGIWSGSLAIVDKLWDYKHNDLVVAWCEGGFMLKQLISDDTGVYLKSFNNRFKPIQLIDNEDSRLWGKVTHIINYITL